MIEKEVRIAMDNIGERMKNRYTVHFIYPSFSSMFSLRIGIEREFLNAYGYECDTDAFLDGDKDLVLMVTWESRDVNNA